MSRPFGKSHCCLRGRHDKYHNPFGRAIVVAFEGDIDTNPPDDESDDDDMRRTMYEPGL
jgi:hypothetical protein